ncbi:MAG: ammonium transporter, partial [Methylophilaceae bacterium]|nr:ammonium transporter [Methylophilaceae bacterium]
MAAAVERPIPESVWICSKSCGNFPPCSSMMVCAALVLFMTLPGLFLFYGGLVRSKNVLSVIAQCFGLAGLVTILWWAVGYSFVFGKSFDGTLLGHIFGGSEYFFLNGVNSLPNTDYSYWTSQNVFA